MAISRIQQSQISGSLAHSSVEVTGSDLIGQSSLNADLDVLRSLIKDMKGSNGNWYDAASQDLAEIYAAVRASGSDAVIQGDLTGSANLAVVGTSLLGGAVTMGNTLGVAGAATFNSTLQAGASTLASLNVSGNATFSSISGSAGLKIAGDADFNGGVAANEIKIDGDAAWPGRFYIVGSSGEIADSSAMSLVNGHLSLTGSAGFTSFVNVAGALSVSGAGLFASDVAVVGDLTGSSGLLVQGAADLDGALDVAGAVNLQDALTVAGAADLNGALDVAGIADFASNVYAAANLEVSGAFVLAGAADLNGALDVAGAVTMQSTLGVAGDITGSSGLKIDGAVDFNGALDVAGASTLASVAVTGNAAVGGTLDVTGATSLSSATLSSTLEVTGNATFSSISGSAGLKIAGDADFNGGVVANSIKIDGDTATRLYIVDSDGSMKDEQYLTYAGGQLKIDSAGGQGGLWVTGNAQVDGDLLVKGAFTYIETQNLAVKDAFIYLATGSAGSSDSGIVFSKGAGGAWDLILGQDGGGGEIVFAKQSHSASYTSPADIAGSALVPVWMSEVKLGLNEGALSGSLKAVAGDGVSLVSSGPISFEALGASALAFNGSGNTAPVGFNDSSSMMAMFNELRAGLSSVAAGGSNQKESYGIADFTGNVLSFTNSQSISSGDHDLLDVYLNGVLMAPGRDLTAIATTSVTFDSSIVSSLIADDVIVVISRG